MSGKESESYSPEDEAAITEYLKQYDHYRSVSVMAQVLVEIGRGFGRLSYPAIDQILRKMKSKTFLVAIPFNMHDQFVCIDTISGEERPFYLWICVNGQTDVTQKLQEIGVTAEANQENLKQTGILGTKPGTLFSQQLQAPNN